MDLAGLLDTLAYKRQVLEQLLTVASIFGGFAVTGVVALRSEERRDRTHSLAFAAMSVSSVAFIFATALDAIWLPMSREVHTVAAARAVLSSGDSVAYAVMLGAVSLTVAVGLLGFARSRAMGYFVLALALAAVVAFVAAVRMLAVSA